MGTVSDERTLWEDSAIQEKRKKAEEICMDFLRANPQTLELVDARECRVLQDVDADCVWHLYDGTVHLAEIKSDNHLCVSGKVLFEVLRINYGEGRRCCTLGWASRSPAEWLLYYAPKANGIYVCRFSDLRRCFQAYVKSARRETDLRFVDTDQIKGTVNVLIPWHWCKACFRVYDAETFEKRLAP